MNSRAGMDNQVLDNNVPTGFQSCFAMKGETNTIRDNLRNKPTTACKKKYLFNQCIQGFPGCF